MDKRPLIVVSLCAVILLVLGSLSNVVGYESVKSTTISDSPLFQTRTQRATNQQQNILTFQYLGIGKGNLIQFPIQDSRIEQLNKVIELISKMDDTTFAQFTEVCIKKARQDDTLRGICCFQMIQVLHLLKIKPEAIMNSITERDNHNMTSGYLTCDIPIACLWFLLLWPICSLIWRILELLFPTTGFQSCRSTCICQH